MFLKFKKGTQKVLAKMGKREISVDDEYDEYQSQIIKEQNVVNSLQKDLNQFNTHFLGMINSLRGILNESQKSYEESDSICECIDAIQEEIIAVHGTFSQYRDNVNSESEKIKEYANKYGGLKQLMLSRENTKIKYDKFLSSVKQMTEKSSSTDPMKFVSEKEKLEKATKEYNEAAVICKKKFVELLEQVGDVFDPFVQSFFIENQKLFENLNTSFQKISNLAKKIESSPSFKGTTVSITQMESGSSQPVEKQSEPIRVMEPEQAVQKIIPPSSDNIKPKKKSSESGDLSTEEFSEFFEDDWYYEDDKGNPFGPIDWMKFKTIFQLGKIRRNFKVVGGPYDDFVLLSKCPKLIKAMRVKGTGGHLKKKGKRK